MTNEQPNHHLRIWAAKNTKYLVWGLLIGCLVLAGFFLYCRSTGHLPSIFYSHHNRPLPNSAETPESHNNSQHSSASNEITNALSQAFISYTICVALCAAWLIWAYWVEKREKLSPESEPLQRPISTEVPVDDPFWQFLSSHSFQLLWLFCGAMPYFFFHWGDLYELLEQAKNLEVLVKLSEATMIAAFVSLVFDVAYHESAFGGEVEKLRESFQTNQLSLDESTKTVNTLDNAVKELARFLAYDSFRKEVLKEYGGAQFRIISIADNWSIDKNWWDAPKDWENTDLYRELIKAYGQVDACKVNTLEVIFAGDVPKPIYTKTPRGEKAAEKRQEVYTFNEKDFLLFLGVMWRVVIAHKVRHAIRKKHNIPGTYIPLKVLFDRVPLSMTIVDNSVWLVLPDQDKTDSDSFRAFHYTKNENDNADNPENAAWTVEIADTFVLMARRFLREARSAREYLQATLLTAALCNQEPNLETSIFKIDRPETEEVILSNHKPESDNTTRQAERLFDPLWQSMLTLGYKKWETDFAAKSPHKDKEKLEEAVYHLMNAFRDSLETSVSFREKSGEKSITFRDLMKDLT
jgi:hypothetical protein